MDQSLPSTDLIAGVSGSARNACVALCSPEAVLGVCEQERITRIRAAGFNSTGLPDEALDTLLRRAGRGRADVARVVAESEHHFGHACAAFLPSPFQTAAIVVCDHNAPEVSVWQGDGTSITRVDYPWKGIGFAELYSQCANALGFSGAGKEQRMEALARLHPFEQHTRAEQLFALEEARLRLDSNWQLQIERWADTNDSRATIAAALQSRLGDLLLQFLADVKRLLPSTTSLCVGGSLFYNSYLNSRAKMAGGFEAAFVPTNPGGAGLSLGAALHASRKPRQVVSPFLGPWFSSEEIKAALDNCKITYKWVSESDRIAIAVRALQRGHLVAWFDEAMEWGPRALGARSIVASPIAPYVLDNLNRFLKQRDPWRGYALSGTASAIDEHFAGPADSPFMECDFVPHDREFFRHILPGPCAAVRVHTVEQSRSPNFHALLETFGDASGVSVLVNTSFNGFQEPIVCSPRDAIRVFFGTGIDLLVLGQFIVAK